MQKSFYVIAYLLVLTVLGVKLLSSVTTLGQGVTQGSEIAQLKYKQRQLQLQQQQLEKQIAQQAALSKAVSTQDTNAFGPISQVAVISETGLALAQ